MANYATEEAAVGCGDAPRRTRQPDTTTNIGVSGTGTGNVGTGNAVSSTRTGNATKGIGVSLSENAIYTTRNGIHGNKFGKSLHELVISVLHLGDNLTFTNPINHMPTVTSGRVDLPNSPKEGFALAQKIYEKHQADGTTSELKQLVDTDWDVVGPTIAVGQGYHTEAERLKGLMEEQYRKRDAIFEKVEQASSDTASYLKGKYKKTPKALANWGFAVDDTPKAKKKA